MPDSSRQPGNIVPTIFITLLAAYGIGVSIPKSSPRTSPQSAKSSSTASSALSTGSTRNEYGHSAIALLRQFLATSTVEEEEDKPWLDGDSQQSGEFGDNDSRRNYSIKFLIATLPEPFSPALRSSFDNELDAITAAANDASYTLDSFDLPWQDAAKSQPQGLQLAPEIEVFAGNPTPTAAASGTRMAGPIRSRKFAANLASPVGPTATLQYTPTTTPSPKPVELYSLRSKREADRRWEREPGLILFRGVGKNQNQLRLLFLVGETPTRGINKMPMRDALDQIAWLWTLPDRREYQHLRQVVGSSLLCCGKEPASKDLAILGPSFSGSAPSMRNELESWLGAIARSYPGLKVKFHLFSGSATAINKAELTPDKCSSCLTWEPLLAPDNDRWRLTASLLHNGVSAIAPLVSSNPGDSTTTNPDDSRPTVAVLTEQTTYGITSRPVSVQWLPFPLHISDLRTAFDNGKQPEMAGGVVPHPPDVPEANEAGQQREDVPPSFSTRSPAYNQFILRQLMTAIKREHLRYVVIMASDIEDLVFLANNVRQYSPDSWIFVLSSDLWVLRTAVNRDLYGTIVVSSYPPFSALAELWRQFPNENAQGVYNATLAGLGWPMLELEQGAPFTINPSKQPVLWASVVGLDEIWPLGFQLTGTAGRPDLDLLSTLGCPTYPLRFILLITALAMFCLLTALALLRPLYAQHLAFSGRWIATNTPDWITRLTDGVDKQPFAALQGLRRKHLASLGVGLLIATIIGAGYFWLPLRICGVLQIDLRLLLLGIFALLSLILSALAAGVAAWNVIYPSGRNGWRSSRGTRRTWSWVCSCGIILFSPIGLCFYRTPFLHILWFCSFYVS